MVSMKGKTCLTDPQGVGDPDLTYRPFGQSVLLLFPSSAE